MKPKKSDAVIRILRRLRHPIGPIRRSDRLAFAAVAELIEHEFGVEPDPANLQVVADLGGIPRRVRLI